MAEKNTDPEATSGKKRKGKKKLVLVLVVFLLLAGGGGGLAFYLLGGKDHSAAGETPKRKMPVFVDLDTFTVNLKDSDGGRFLQARLVVEVADAAGGETIKALMPEVRNHILLLLGSKEPAQLATREAKEALAKEIVDAANTPLAGTPSAGAVLGVNFTHIIIQ